MAAATARYTIVFLVAVSFTPKCAAFVPPLSRCLFYPWEQRFGRLLPMPQNLPLGGSPGIGQDAVVDCGRGGGFGGYWGTSIFGSHTSAAAAAAATTTGRDSAATATAAAAKVLPAVHSGLLQNVTPWKRNAVMVLFAVMLFAWALLYLLNHQKGLQRMVLFWSTVTPWIVELKFTQYKAKYVDRLDPVAYQQRMDVFHRKTAPKIMNLIHKTGGIYVKMGQVLATVGVGIIPDEYIQQLKPLQDGIPPRSLDEMAGIFEMSTGKKFEEVFQWIDDKPIGAASIGQAHKAILKKEIGGKGIDNNNADDDVVVVKIQYPEVEELFTADLDNLELCVRILIPGSQDSGMIQSLRARHQKELDYRDEAQHLRECGENMARHGLEPHLVRIPRVRNETGVCTKHVLVMEYLQGTTLNAAIAQEQDRIARAIGKEDGEELREAFLNMIVEQMEQHNHTEPVGAGGGHVSDMGIGDHLQKLFMGPVGGAIFRTYVRLRNGLDDVRAGLVDLLLPTVHGPEGLQHRQRTKRDARPINMGRVFKTLIRVHGLQFLRDGVYNADPHPGNILILPDGRLGLLDYGMVGRMTPTERKTAAKIILALNKRDKLTIQKIYQKAGYRASWSGGNVTEDVNLLHRFAILHWDKFDISPFVVTTTKPSGSDDAIIDANDNRDTHRHHHETPRHYRKSMKFLDVLQTVQEHAVPDWVEQGRRLTNILNGVTLQAGWPQSIVKEWRFIAEEVDRELKDKDDEEGN